MNYTWKIEAVDNSARTMLVEFNKEDVVTMLNLPLPPADAVIGDWIDKFAPRQQWIPPATQAVVVGATGSAAVELPAPAAPSEPPQTSGSVNEEYLRALIFQVIEEINAAAV